MSITPVNHCEIFKFLPQCRLSICIGQTRRLIRLCTIDWRKSMSHCLMAHCLMTRLPWGYFRRLEVKCWSTSNRTVILTVSVIMILGLCLIERRLWKTGVTGLEIGAGVLNIAVAIVVESLWTWARRRQRCCGEVKQSLLGLGLARARQRLAWHLTTPTVACQSVRNASHNLVRQNLIIVKQLI